MGMSVDLVARIIFSLLFIGVLSAGCIGLKNFDKLFGADPDVPGDTAASRSFGKVEFFLLWLHALALTGAFAFLS